MIVNSAALGLALKGFETIYSEANLAAVSQYARVAMDVPSSAQSEDCGWLGQWPNMREWIGARHVNNLSASGFTIKNRLFESTVSIKRTDIEDDRLGLFAPVFREMAATAKRHPDEIVFGLLKQGFATNACDGQFFFDADHPVLDETGATVSVANTEGGSGAPWFLLDTTRAMRPVIWQTRTLYELQHLDGTSDENVLLRDEFLYGVRARPNAGFGLWQLAWGSRQPLTPASYAAARAAMQAFRGDGGRLLGIMPNLLAVSPANEEAARKIVNSQLINAGESNIRGRFCRAACLAQAGLRHRRCAALNSAPATAPLHPVTRFPNGSTCFLPGISKGAAGSSIRARPRPWPRAAGAM